VNWRHSALNERDQLDSIRVRSQIQDMATSTDESVPEAAALIATLLRLCGGTCRDCTQLFANTEALFSIALGFSFLRVNFDLVAAVKVDLNSYL
jgi:hypothetical protein